MLRVDGGMARNDWVMQFLADILDLPVERPVVTETTALGAAVCAGLGTGMFSIDRGSVAATGSATASSAPRHEGRVARPNSMPVGAPP